LHSPSTEVRALRGGRIAKRVTTALALALRAIEDFLQDQRLVVLLVPRAI
jgi:hypothetical protein